jgi:hypothetical protein
VVLQAAGSHHSQQQQQQHSPSHQVHQFVRVVVAVQPCLPQLIQPGACTDKTAAAEGHAQQQLELYNLTDITREQCYCLQLAVSTYP